MQTMGFGKRKKTMPAIPDNIEQFKKHTASRPAVEKVPVKCHHPIEYQEAGFGLAGGGYGPYMYCGACGEILSKTQER